ncbi:hypothetical protein GCM10011594_37890 [Nakamurella endophytica]|uniref:Uncharacterized protein n=1 Tax=Nakamurella endophytica TaxID=1748367 RepID=A0A917T9H0_9ACTN|nr:hypothetical protein GCM10011594_37890 [Nakamurella endophytica]
MLGEWRDGRWVEPGLTGCPSGHPFGPQRVLVGWRACLCQGEAGVSGHRLYYCRTCAETVSVPECVTPEETTVDQQGLRSPGARGGPP